MQSGRNENSSARGHSRGGVTYFTIVRCNMVVAYRIQYDSRRCIANNADSLWVVLHAFLVLRRPAEEREAESARTPRLGARSRDSGRVTYFTAMG